MFVFIFLIIFVFVAFMLLSGAAAGILLGGRIVRTTEGVMVRSGGHDYRLVVHAVETSKRGMRVGLEMKRSGNLMVVSMAPDQALELAGQLREAAGAPVGEVVEIEPPAA